MYNHYKEAALALTYRQQEIKCIVKSLLMQRSVRVAGLSGMGKSNLLRFLVSHPQLLPHKAALEGKTVKFLHVDANKLNPLNELSFYREVLLLLTLEPEISPSPSDGYLAFKQVETALQQVDQQSLIILVIDRAERLYDSLGPEFFGQLRSLRDGARAGQMIFILGSQKPLGDLLELEKLFNQTCWVGPLAITDREAFISRHEKRLFIDVGEKMRHLLWEISGAHPGFLKNSLEWVGLKGVETIPQDKEALIQGLLEYPPLQNYCRRLWQNLSPQEQNFLPDLATRLPANTIPSLLKNSGLVINKAQQLALFSPLWATYLQQQIWSQQRIAPMEIGLNANTRRVTLQWRGRSAETMITRALVFDFLQALAATPGQVQSKDDLINTIYREEQAHEVMDDALFQLVTALRKTLDKLVKDLCPAMTQSSIQNVRGVGYRLVVDLPTESGVSDRE